MIATKSYTNYKEDIITNGYEILIFGDIEIEKRQTSNKKAGSPLLSIYLNPLFWRTLNNSLKRFRIGSKKKYSISEKNFDKTIFSIVKECRK